MGGMGMSVNPYLGTQQWVINCWIYGSDEYADVPDCVLGPYPTSDDAETAAEVLTCTKRIERLRLRLIPPEWTTS